MPFNGIELIGILASYLLGSLCTGYYLIRVFANKDIREHGSGGVGATNVGRILGKKGFILTLLGDTLKGVIVVVVAKYLHFSADALALVVIAVIVGHLWPIMLGFRGGKGVATSLGALLIYDYMFIVLFMVISVLSMVVLRRLTLSGLVGYLVLPVVVIALGYPLPAIYTALLSSVLVLYAHRDNIRQAFRISSS